MVMKDYAQYTSRIPTPAYKGNNGATVKSTTTNVKDHPLAVTTPEKETSTSTASSSSVPSSAVKQPQHTSYSHSPPRNGASNNNYNNNSGNDANVQQLQSALEEAIHKEESAKHALAKSDSVILDLRSNIRQIKRQLEQVQQDKHDVAMQLRQAQEQLQHSQQQIHSSSQDQLQQQKEQIQTLQNKIRQISESADDPKVGELQVRLDRAHAQILTADMVRKELEDTLEAEQYTWELRVQDQERTISQLQHECQTLSEDLETCRTQWKEAEEGWNAELHEMQGQLRQHQQNAPNVRELQSRITVLEQERSELQGCLDEALQELEAVDVELQQRNESTPARDSLTSNKDNDGNDKVESQVLEPLQHCVRWIQEHDESSPKSGHSISKDPQELIQEIQAYLHSSTSSSSSQEVQDLQTQVQRLKQELKEREESSNELRESLKEAVELLKPLQDAVDTAEKEKQELQSRVDKLQLQQDQATSKQREETAGLEDQIQSLKEQLEEQKQLARARQALLSNAAEGPANGAVKSPGAEESLSKIQRAREELRRKRESEGNLQQLLRDAQSRFHTLHQQNEDVAARNRELQGKLKEAEDQLDGGSLSSLNHSPSHELDRVRQELVTKDRELQSLREELDKARIMAASQTSADSDMQQLQLTQQQLKLLEDKLHKTHKELAEKKQAERTLNNSLREALGLLKPLQMHLEDAEKEKMEISKELRNLRKRFRQLQMGDGDDQSRSTLSQPGEVSFELLRVKEELEETVRQLELENSQLHDALEDLSNEGDGNNNNNGGGGRRDAKLRQKIVELNSRYEVTQNKLEDAHVENHALVKALKQKEMEERRRQDEIKALKEKLEKSESELYNAKAIAKSALVKVEELTMANVEQLSLTRDGPLDLELDFKVDPASL